MTAHHPSKPWRVIVTGPADVTAESDYANAAKAYSAARTALAGVSPARTAEVRVWDDDRWWHDETLRPEDVNVEETPWP